MQEKASELSKKIIEYSKSKVLINFKFFALALFHANLLDTDMIKTAASNKNELLYNPNYIIQLYKEGIEEVNHLYLHMVIHLLFHHAYFSKGKDINLWNIACDIVAESIIIDLKSFVFSSKKDKERISFIKKLKDNNIDFVAETIYKFLESKNLTQTKIQYLNEVFAYDSHELWNLDDKLTNSQNSKKKDGETSDIKNEQGNSDKNKKSLEGEKSSNSENESNSNNEQDNSDNNESLKDNNTSNNENESNSNNEQEISFNSIIESQNDEQNLEKWKDIAIRVSAELSMAKQHGIETGNLEKNLDIARNDVVDYEEFLSIFGKIRDVMKINDDEFDFLFYTYGINTYGNIPIIEPLEYKDEKKIVNFVIAIDTSGSTQGKIVQEFLNKTYAILRNALDNKKRIFIHVLQADTMVKKDDLIQSLNDLEEYINNYKVIGGGGTDFRPVFTYVENQINQRLYPNINGLIYFTDGYGVFPTEKPSFKTAFVFLREYPMDVVCPAWAYKMVLKDNGENL